MTDDVHRLPAPDPFLWLELCPPLEPEDVLGTYIYFRAMLAAPQLVDGKWKLDSVRRAYPRTIAAVWAEDCARVRSGGRSLFRSSRVVPTWRPPRDHHEALREMYRFLGTWWLTWNSKVRAPAQDEEQPANPRHRELRRLIESLDPFLKHKIDEPGLVAAVRNWAIKKGMPQDDPVLRQLTARDIAAELVIALGNGQHPLFTGDDGVVRTDYRLIADAIVARWRRQRRETLVFTDAKSEPDSAGGDSPFAACETHDLLARLVDELDAIDQFIVQHPEMTNVELGEAAGITEGAIRKRRSQIRDKAIRLTE